MHESKNKHFYEGGCVKGHIHSPCNGGMILEIGIHLVWCAEKSTTDFSKAMAQGRDVPAAFPPLQFTYLDSTFLYSCLHYFDKQVFINCIEK